jgi:hypothetical protein
MRPDYRGCVARTNAQHGMLPGATAVRAAAPSDTDITWLGGGRPISIDAAVIKGAQVACRVYSAATSISQPGILTTRVPVFARACDPAQLRKLTASNRRKESKP